MRKGSSKIKGLKIEVVARHLRGVLDDTNLGSL
jgi:hypothetical protein